LPLAFAAGDRGFELRQSQPQAAIAQLRVKGKRSETSGILYDALVDPAFCQGLLAAMARGKRYKGGGVELIAQPTRLFRRLRGDIHSRLEPSILKREQSNTSVVFGDKLVLKLFRRVAEGTNPDLEIGRFLTERAEFAHTPPLAGALQLRKGRGDPATLGILQGWVANEGDAWRYTLDHLESYFEEILTRKPSRESAMLPPIDLTELVELEIPPAAQELIGSYLTSAHLLGQRTGELHVALASDPKEPAFAPEPFTALYRRSLYQSMRTLADQSIALLRKRLKGLPAEDRPAAERVVGLEAKIFDRFRQLVEARFSALRIRCHGDYHLGQVLFTGRDFVIVDFEGEPARPLSERRIKRSPLRDVAGMLRSFDYAAVTELHADAIRAEDREPLKPWAKFWHLWVSVSYLKGYFEASRRAKLLPESASDKELMLETYLLEKAVYELGYELNNRPDWVHVPIEGILTLLEEGA
jgi:maltose alpha-D-glucosyltransferase/alpha-amylase